MLRGLLYGAVVSGRGFGRKLVPSAWRVEGRKGCGSGASRVPPSLKSRFAGFPDFRCVAALPHGQPRGCWRARARNILPPPDVYLRGKRPSFSHPGVLTPRPGVAPPPPTCPTSAVRRRRWPYFAQRQPRVCSTGRMLFETSARLAEAVPNLVDAGPEVVETGRSPGPELAEAVPKLPAQIQSKRSTPPCSWSKPTQLRSKAAEVWPKPAQSCWTPASTHRHTVGRNRPNVGRSGPNFWPSRPQPWWKPAQIRPAPAHVAGRR